LPLEREESIQKSKNLVSERVNLNQNVIHLSSGSEINIQFDSRKLIKHSKARQFKDPTHTSTHSQLSHNTAHSCMSLAVDSL
jgi:hypothetical protein